MSEPILVIEREGAVARLTLNRPRTRNALSLALGDAVSGERALELGLANRLVPPEALRREATALASRLADGPPLALALIKRAARDALAGTLDDALLRERQGQAKCLTSEDCLAGVLAWAQRQPPVFQGR